MIIRAIHNKENPYFLARRETAQDKGLSWGARGLLFYLFSKPDGWTLQIVDLEAQGDLKRQALYRLVKELESAGYAQRRQERNADGTIGRWVTDVHEHPHADYPHADFQHVDNQHVDNIDKEKVQIAKITEQQSFPQARIIAAASGNEKQKSETFASWTEEHRSEHLAATVCEYVRTTKSGKINPRGLAREIWRSGEEDEMIWQWLEKFAQEQNRSQTEKQQQKKHKEQAITIFAAEQRAELRLKQLSEAEFERETQKIRVEIEARLSEQQQQVWTPEMWHATLKSNLRHEFIQEEIDSEYKQAA